MIETEILSPAILMNLGGIGVAIYILWDNQKRFCRSLDRNTEAIEDMKDVMAGCKFNQKPEINLIKKAVNNEN